MKIFLIAMVMIAYSIPLMSWTDKKVDVEFYTGYPFISYGITFCQHPDHPNVCKTVYVVYRETDGSEDIASISFYIPDSNMGYIGIENIIISSSSGSTGPETMITYDVLPSSIPVTSEQEIIDYINNN